MFLGGGSQQSEAGGLEISDLMMALVAVFLLFSVLMKDMLTGLSGEATINKKRVDKLLSSKLSDVRSSSKIEILEGGIIRFRGKFGTSESGITKEMKTNLDDVCKPLVRMVIKYADLIEVVSFEGHASKSWAGSDTETPFYGNKELSNWRAVNTMRYCLGDDFEQTHPHYLEKFVAVGYSYSRPIKNKYGNPDWKRSKRVDIVIHSKGAEYD
jgi:flagellar motor protein MotB